MKAFLVTEKQELVQKHAEGCLAACEHCGCVIFFTGTNFPDTGLWRECPAETGDHFAQKLSGSGVYRYFRRIALS